MSHSTFSIQHSQHPTHTISAPQKPQKKMSLTQTFFLAYSARSKLSKAASQPDHDLRLLVGHANMLDALMLDLNEAERAQERYYDQSTQDAIAHKASRHQQEQEAQQPTQHIRWADNLKTTTDTWDEEAISDDDDEDFDDDEEEEDVGVYSYPDHYTAHRTSATHKVPEVYYGSTFDTSAAPQWSVSTQEIGEADSDDEDDYAIEESYDEDEEDEDDDYFDAVAAEAEEEEMNGGLSLRRVSSHGQRPPELLPPDLEDEDEDESSDEESLPSPLEKTVSFTSKKMSIVDRRTQSPSNTETVGDNSKQSQHNVAITVKPIASPPLPGQRQDDDDSLLLCEEGDSYFPAQPALRQ
ncbi:hypothetical protein KEM56_007670 [Ascosphaera pollenicola]|nr:hypothetical protein KEM56_007670 [Ascosphaera pollenicola]